MKVTACIALLCLACAAARPMFGTAGMMRRRFPGATDMSYQTYRSIADANSQASALSADAHTRARADQATKDGWMFGNDIVTTRTGSSQQTPRKTVVYPDYYDTEPQQQNDYYRYPSSFSPREDFAAMQFPYQAPQDVQYRRSHGQQPVYFQYY